MKRVRGWAVGVGVTVWALVGLNSGVGLADDEGPSKGDAAVALRSARLYMKQQLWDKALEQLEVAVKGDSMNAEAHFLLGELHADRDNVDLMNRHFDVVGRLKSGKYEKDIQAWRAKVWTQHYNNGVRAFQKDKMEEALKEFNTAVGADSTRLEAYKNLGVAYLKMDRVEQGIEVFEKIVRRDPKDKTSFVNLGVAYYNFRKPEKALESFQAAARLDPKSPDILEKLIMGYETLAMSTKDSVRVGSLYDSAMVVCDLALALDSKNGKIAVAAGRLHLNRAMILLASGKREDSRTSYSRAEGYLKTAVELNPNDGSSVFNLGICYIQLDRYDDALAMFRKAVEIDPKDFDAWLQLGLIQVKKNDLDGAIATFKKVTETKPDHVRAWEYLASMYAQKDLPREAKEAYDMAQALKAQGKN